MAGERLVWPNRVQCRDYHLVPGSVSPRFDQILRIKYIDGHESRADRPDLNVSVSFRTRSPQPLLPLPGVTLDGDTGQVEVASPLPAAPAGTSWPQNVWVYCEVTEGGMVRDQQRFGFWVHERLDRGWLTPVELTIRQGAKGVRFSLMAMFTDGVVADISNWSPMEPPQLADRTFVSILSTLHPVRWESTGGGVAVPNSTTGFLDCTSASASSTIRALFNAPPLPARWLTAQAKGAASWSTRTQLTQVTPDSTFATMAQRRNVIILPDGFDNTVPGQAEFEALARGVVDRLTKNKLTRPYDLLKDQFNFFMAWVPSPDSDIMVSADLVRQAYSGPPTPIPGLTLHDAVLYDGHISGPHFLLNERDTAFHTALGERPAVDEELDPTWPDAHPLRLDPDDFDRFLRNLSSKPSITSHTPEGSVWARLVQNQPEDRYLNGKDESLCVILCRTPHKGGVNTKRRGSDTARTLMVTLEYRTVLYAASNPSGNGDDLVTAALNQAKAAQTAWLVTAHELAHSFRLLDEYGGSSDPLPPGAATSINESANTQLLTTFTGNQLAGNEIKWNWPRIEKAAIYNNLRPVGSQFVCTLTADYNTITDKRDRFAPKDIVRLRTRDLLGNPTFSDFMEVVSAPPKSLDMTLKMRSGATPLSAPFLPFQSAGLLFKTAQTKTGMDLNVVHRDVGARITATRNPLNANPSDPVGRPCTTGLASGPANATNFLGGRAPRPPMKSSWIIGLYESGKAYNCGVYHPSGICVMNETLSGPQVNEFCHVCRYAMVDLLDPLKHSEIDRDYAKRYPK